MLAGKSAVAGEPDMEAALGIRGGLCARVPDIPAREIPRQFRRTMSRMSQFAWLAAREALDMAGLPDETLRGGRVGVVAGSTIGSVDGLEEFFRPYIATGKVDVVKSTLFFKVMNHSAAANLAQAFGVTGPLVAPSAACATGCQALGIAAMLIDTGRADAVLCGGTDEHHALTTATFDIMNAASTSYNDQPGKSPRPFDANRDGVVCSEGAGMLLLESMDAALARGVAVLAEFKGYGANLDTAHIAHPSRESIAACMRLALADAGVGAHEVDYVNAHATGTLQGDEAEGQAIADVFGSNVPVSALKGYFGHAMAASGSLEAIASVRMISEGLVIPTRNLDTPDPTCGHIAHVTSTMKKSVNVAVKNNFALGGVNAVAVLGRFYE
jgi:3-oxoacyl-[acyl-carrier-protein] synthase II